MSTRNCMGSETPFLPASATAASFLKHLSHTFPAYSSQLHHTTDSLQSLYLLFFHMFHGGEEALRCWTAYVYALNLPK